MILQLYRLPSLDTAGEALNYDGTILKYTQLRPTTQTPLKTDTDRKLRHLICRFGFPQGTEPALILISDLCQCLDFQPDLPKPGSKWT